MTRLVFHFSSFVLAFLLHQSLAQKCERINTTVLEGCGYIGYNFTAKFSDIGGQDYQTFVKPAVSMLNGLLENCSSYSKLIVCSRHVPKCVEEVEKPIVPCRDVCEHFVADCSSVLENNKIKKLYSTLCSLLPSASADNSSTCIRPDGFSAKVSPKEGELNFTVLVRVKLFIKIKD